MVTEVCAGYVVGVVVDCPASRGLSCVWTGHIAILLQRRTVVAATPQVDSVVLDLAPFGLQELIGEVGIARCFDVASASDAVLEHLSRRHPQARHTWIDEAVVRS